MQRKFVLAIFFLTASLPLFSQVAPAAMESGLQRWTVGAGFSFFSPDYGDFHLAGGTLWIDDSLNLRQMPEALRGLSIAIEARDLSLDRTPKNPVLRVDTAGGGAIYNWSHYKKFRPYVDFTAGLGNIDYITNGTNRYHQSRTVTGIGGGVDIKAFRSVWVRADYEYQFWPNFWITKVGSPNGAALNPQGLTVGAIYRFGSDRHGY
jgi:hypothetical protein